MRSPTRTSWTIGILVVVLLSLLAAAWKWTDLAEWADVERISGYLEPLRSRWYGVLVVVSVFVVAELVLFPVLVLVVVCGIAFGPVLGPLYALAGSMASALPPFFLGRKLGRARVERMGGSIVRRISTALEKKGIVAIFLVRKVPAPYTLVNLVCGASPVSLRDFLVGTLLGMGTGVLLLTVLGAQIVDLVHDPRPAGILGALALLFAPLVLALGMQRVVNRRSKNGQPDRKSRSDATELEGEEREVARPAEPAARQTVAVKGRKVARRAKSAERRATARDDSLSTAKDDSLSTAKADRPPAAKDGILRPGENCWRVERAERFRCVQDGEEYFRLVREAILAARRSVFILGWDIYASLDLAPGKSDDGAPTKLAELLDFVARRTPELEVFVLVWDYAALFVLERDPLSRFRLGVRTHERVRFQFDGLHPVAGSHHQKVVVVDDRLAFSGGIDLTSHRWDTVEHALDHPLRLTANGEPYEPYHDVQALVEGPVAAALGELARERWTRLGARDLPPLEPRTDSLWPDGVPTDLRDVDVAIARTDPEFRGRAGVRECEELFLAQIAAAQRVIYVENQYFTNARIGEAFARRLRERDGPELVVVGPRNCEGWLERKTMGALRHRVLRGLLDADRHGRLRLLHPAASRSRDVCTFVHSKVLVIDDEHLRIGSANLSGRSMGMDSECDLIASASGDAGLRRGIRSIRDRLVGEHFGVDATAVARAIRRRGSLCGAIDALATGDRALVPSTVGEGEEQETLDALGFAIDPEEPMALSREIDRLLPALEADDSRKALRAVFVAVCVAGVLALAVRGVEGAASLDAQDLRDFLNKIAVDEGAGPWIFAALIAGGLLFLPFEILVLAPVVLLEPGHGISLAIAAGLVCATLGYAVGRALGPQRILPLIPARARNAWRSLGRYGILSVAIVRFVALFSATSVHVLCGAARVGLREFALGSLLGLAPALLASLALGVLLRQAIFEPSPLRIVVVVCGALLSAALVLRFRRIVLMKAHGRAAREHTLRSRYG